VARMSQDERSTITEQIRVAEQAIASARMKLMRDIINNCDHEWRDDSYTNGHNGNYEDQYKCVKCGWQVGHVPKAVEHM
jgi:hypothetical protein